MVRVQKRGYVSGLEGMIGERGKTITALTPSGRIYLHGEYWDARAEQEITEGTEVEVVRSEPNLKLLVRAVKADEQESEAKEADHVSD